MHAIKIKNIIKIHHNYFLSTHTQGKIKFFRSKINVKKVEKTAISVAFLLNVSMKVKILKKNNKH